MYLCWEAPCSSSVRLNWRCSTACWHGSAAASYCCSTAASAWANQLSHTTPLPDEVTRQVTIIDPAHPLFGHIFPLSQSTSPQGPAYILIQLPNGRRRAVLRVATDLDGTPPPRPVPAALPRISVRTILLAHRVRTLVLAMEDCHAGTHTSPGTALRPMLVETGLLSQAPVMARRAGM